MCGLSGEMLAVSEKTENHENSRSASQPLFLQPRRRRAGRRVVRAAGAAGSQQIAVHVDGKVGSNDGRKQGESASLSHTSADHSLMNNDTRKTAASNVPDRPAAKTEPIEMPAARSRRRAPRRRMSLDDIRLPEGPTAPSRNQSRAASPKTARAGSMTGTAISANKSVAANKKASQADNRSARTAALAAELFSDTGVSEPQTGPKGIPASSPAPRRPISSLLFQAPNLASGEENTTEQEGTVAPSRRHRRSRSHAHRSERRALDQQQGGETPAPKRRTRLNASERAAAAEVKFIEDDIARDAVRKEALSGDENSGEASAQQEQAGDGLRIRRRRRLHSGSYPERRSPVSERTATAAHPAAGTRRQREKAYISKIKDVSGSTRLEAKRRRRRETRRDRTRQSFLLEQEAMARQEHVDRQMIVRERGRHTQISVLEDNILVEHYVSDIDEVSTVGNIYVGRVQNVLPGMEAAFVNIGEARNGVLYSGEVNWDATRLEGKPQRIELAYHSGDPIMVQVTKDPIGHKGARLTAQITLAGRYLVLVPSGAMTGVSRKLPERERVRLRQIVSRLTPKDMGVIIRTAADGASEEALKKDFATLLTRWKNVKDRYNEFKDTHRPHILHREPDVAIRVVRDIFNDDFRRLVVEGDSVYRRIRDYLEEMSPDQLGKLEKWDPAEHHGVDVFDPWQIDSQLRKGMERKVYLPSGGSLVIDRTEAMTTIDVNTGRFVGKGKSLEEIVTRVNLEAAEEIVRQLRLRDIGGMIMIDFVDMVMAENRDLVLRRLIECLSRDRTKHQVAEVTSLGLVQMTRKRVGQGLVEAFSEECPMCHGRGFIIHDEPTIRINAADPYEAKGGDPFEKSSEARREVHRHEEYDASAPKGSSAEVRRKLAQIAAAATREEEAEKTSK